MYTQSRHGWAGQDPAMRGKGEVEGPAGAALLPEHRTLKAPEGAKD